MSIRLVCIVLQTACLAEECYLNNNNIDEELNIKVVFPLNKSNNNDCYPEWTRLGDLNCTTNFTLMNGRESYWCSPSTSGHEWDPDIYATECLGMSKTSFPEIGKKYYIECYTKSQHKASSWICNTNRSIAKNSLIALIRQLPAMLPKLMLLKVKLYLMKYRYLSRVHSQMNLN